MNADKVKTLVFWVTLRSICENLRSSAAKKPLILGFALTIDFNRFSSRPNKGCLFKVNNAINLRAFALNIFADYRAVKES